MRRPFTLLVLAQVLAAAAGPTAGAAAAEPAPALVIMLRPAPHAAPARPWRRAFCARAHDAGLIVRDTLDHPDVPWTLRVLRAEIDGARLAQDFDPAPEPRGSRFAGAPRGLAALARRIAADPAVAWAEPDYAREPAWIVDDSLPPEPLLCDSRQWGLYNVGPDGAYGGALRADVHAPEAWRAAAAHGDARPRVRLAVADTGIDPAHPEFADPATGRPRIVAARPIADPAGSIDDSLGHGTMVAAVMAAAIGEGVHFDSLGMAGVCGDCDLVPLRITSGAASTASSFDIALAILAATDAGARALNLSFAGGGRSRLERLALAYALAHGTVVVAASGNRGYTEPWRLMYPAAYAAEGLCIAVGASDMWDGRAAFSSYGPHLDFVAPGLHIWSAWMTHPAPTGVTYPGYVAGSGTSFAAPFATGTIGLLAESRPDLAAADFQPLLAASADEAGAPGIDAETGAGRLNAGAALVAVAPGVGVWHDEVAATEWRDAAAGTLAIAEDGPGAFAARWSGARATRVAFTARRALPDSFAAGARVWPRVTATTTLGPDFAQPWYAPACDAAIEGRTIVFRGDAFRIDADEAPAGTPADDLWVPLPPDQMRFGFTVLGEVRRGAGARPPRSPAPPRLAASPNPARGPVRIELPGAGRLAIFDPGGRVVWRGARAAGAGPIEWPGTDAAGRPAPPGLYLMRYAGAAGTRSGRLVRIE